MSQLSLNLKTPQGASRIKPGGVALFALCASTGALAHVGSDAASHHGMAHGTELAGIGWFAPLFGMVIGIVALHLAGMGGGLAMRQKSPWGARVAGTVVAVVGSALLVQAV